MNEIFDIAIGTSDRRKIQCLHAQSHFRKNRKHPFQNLAVHLFITNHAALSYSGAASLKLGFDQRDNTAARFQQMLYSRR